MSAVAIRDNAAKATAKKAQEIIDELNAQLRARAAEADRLQAMVDTQAEQLRQVHHLLSDVTEVFGHDSSIDAWIFANTPKQEEQQNGNR